MASDAALVGLLRCLCGGGHRATLSPSASGDSKEQLCMAIAVDLYS